MSERPRVLLAMSGGVDSSVAAALLLREGYDVLGCFMRLGSVGETLDEPSCQAPGEAAGTGAVQAGSSSAAATVGSAGDVGAAPATPTASRSLPLRIHHQGCCSVNDAADARRVAARLGTPFYVVNFKRDFDRIIDHFVEEYNAGRTPNPCVRCNDWLKFGKLHDYAQQVGAEFVASGHYAQVVRDGRGKPQLRRGVDRDKDQSYVLFGVPRSKLARMLLPIGGMLKPEVRAMARELGLPVFDKPDSQEICFVPDNDYAGLVRRRSPQSVRPGTLRDTEGRILGEHPGQQHFTIGQRRGLGVAVGQPLYVVSRDATTNDVVVGTRAETAASRCVAREVNWLVEPPAVDAWRRCDAVIRAHGDPAPARVRRSADGSIEVRFDAPQFAVAPGQAVVLYDGDLVLGGGWIGDVG